MKDKLIYLALGFFMAISLFLLVASDGDDEVGRYQIGGDGTTASMYVLDTKTGAITKFWIRNEIDSRDEYISGDTVKEYLNK
jgi:hypothetical protein